MNQDDVQALSRISIDAIAYLSALRALPAGQEQAAQLTALAEKNAGIVDRVAADLPFDSSPYSFSLWLSGEPL